MPIDTLGDVATTPQLVVLVGIPGSGKSTFYRAVLAATCVLVSKDTMRNVREREARQRRLLDEALRIGASVVVHNTNLTRTVRAPLVELARAHGAASRVYYFPPDLEAALVRNAARTGPAVVPEGIVRQMHRLLEPPDPDEGFDEVLVVTLLEAGFRVERG